MDISILDKHFATMSLQHTSPKYWYPLKTTTQKTTSKKLTMRMSDFIKSQSLMIGTQWLQYLAT